MLGHLNGANLSSTPPLPDTPQGVGNYVTAGEELVASTKVVYESGRELRSGVS